MTAVQKLKREILLSAIDMFPDQGFDFSDVEITEENVNDLFMEFENGDQSSECMNEFRSNGIDTGLSCDYSRHYVSKAVAVKTVDGSWVGWTYLFGGGKYSDPSAVEWMKDAYDVAVDEQEKLVVVREFRKVYKEKSDG